MNPIMTNSRNPDRASPAADLDLYLLIGQSNMAGRGVVEAEDRTAHPRVFSLDRSCQWVPAIDPIHFDKPVAGVGPGVTFGRFLADRDPGVRIGLVPCAVGGSPLSSWRPGGFWEQTASAPYDDALRRTRVALSRGMLKGMLWHQGESDSTEADAPSYEDRLVALITALRTDLAQPSTPFIVATLGDFFVEETTRARDVNDALRRIPGRVPRTACVEAAGLGHGGDRLHFSAEAARELGRRYAQAMIQFSGQ